MVACWSCWLHQKLCVEGVMGGEQAINCAKNEGVYKYIYLYHTCTCTCTLYMCVYLILFLFCCYVYRS